MNAPATQSWESYLGAWEKDFTEKNAFGLKFEAECHFAKQLILKNDKTLAAAQKNPKSLHDAVLNVAAIGISLNPALKHAYLVPRDGAICLDISYRGLIKLACDAGAIITAKAELVHGPRGAYQGDSYKWRGPFLAPEHEADAFHPDRINGQDPLENILGGYCVAILPSSTLMVEQMSAAEIFAVRASSKAFSSGKPCPWKGAWSGQMGKKTLVKRATNSWPQSGQRERIDLAIDVLNQHEGLVETMDSAPAAGANTDAPLALTHQQSHDLLNAIKVAGITEERFCQMARIADIGSLSPERLDGAKARLQQLAQRGTQP